MPFADRLARARQAPCYEQGRGGASVWVVGRASGCAVPGSVAIRLWAARLSAGWNPSLSSGLWVGACESRPCGQFPAIRSGSGGTFKGGDPGGPVPLPVALLKFHISPLMARISSASAQVSFRPGTGLKWCSECMTSPGLYRTSYLGKNLDWILKTL